MIQGREQILEAAPAASVGEVLLTPARNMLEVMHIISNIPEGNDATRDFQMKAEILGIARDTLLEEGPEEKVALVKYQSVASQMFPAKLSDLKRKYWLLDISAFLQRYLGSYKVNQVMWSGLVTKGTLYATVPLVQEFVKALPGKDKEHLRSLAQQIYGLTEKLNATCQIKLVNLANVGSATTIFTALRSCIEAASQPSLDRESLSEKFGQSVRMGDDAVARIGAVSALNHDAVRAAQNLLDSKQEITTHLKYTDHMMDALAVCAKGDNSGSTIEAMKKIKRMISPTLIHHLELAAPDLAVKFQAASSEVDRYFETVRAATYEEFDNLIAGSSATDEEAQGWVSSLTMHRDAKKLFPDENGDSQLNAELIKLYKLAGGRLSGMKKIAIRSGRANAKFSSGTVTLALDDGIDVLWHEVAHLIEFSNADLLGMAKAYLRSKTGPTVNYVRIAGSPSRPEVAVDAGLSTPYIGRIYGDHTIDGTDATEVFSMGVQMAMNGMYGAKSVAENDGLLNFVIGALKGIQEGS